MQRLVLLLTAPCLLLMVLLFPTPATAQHPSPTDSTVIRVLYFHGTIRCHTCLQIEEFTDLTIRSRFHDRIRHGSMEWKAMDYEKDNDTASVRKYGLENQALILSKTINGREVEWKKLNRIWELAEDFDEFQEYLAGSIRALEASRE